MNPQEQPTNNTQPSIPETPFTPAEPPKNNKRMLVIVAIVVAVVVILGAAAFALLGSNKNSNSSNNTPGDSSNNNSTDTNSSKFQKYDVTDKSNGVTYSVSFYKDAKVEEKNGRTYLNSGETGSMYSIYLGAATSDKIDCGDSPTTTMRLAGESTTICYKTDNTQYAGYAKTKSGAVKVNLAGQKAIGADDAKTILESVTFN